ncbi:MAG TPA: hypothetical protein QGF35_04125 [Dehalococcoidia bacterium]|nr:hypothetical protein [Dehalococcoidia bacterium]
MRSFGTIVAAAILLFVAYLFVGTIVDGYLDGNMVPDDAVPEAWAAPDSWSEWRDISLVFAAFAWLLAGLITFVLVLAVILLVLALRRILDQNAVPAIDSLRSTLDNARGTTEFVGETVVSPVIRVYSVFNGVRSSLRAVTSLPGRIGGRRKKGNK